jgi:hypothetical protein
MTAEFVHHRHHGVRRCQEPVNLVTLHQGSARGGILEASRPHLPNRRPPSPR